MFGDTARVWYMLLQASQFHVIYYASRTLPNMFAFGLCKSSLCPLFGPSVDRRQLHSRCEALSSRYEMHLTPGL